MFEKIVTLILIPAMIFLTLPSVPQGLVVSRQSEQVVDRQIGSALQAILLGTKSSDNELFTFTRDLPDAVKPDEVFTVTDSLTAKVDLAFAAIVPSITPGFSLVSGEERIFQLSLTAGTRIELAYQLRAPFEAGDYLLSSNARAKAGTSDSKGLTVDMPIKVTTQTPPTEPPTQPPTEPPTEPQNQVPVAFFTFAPQTPQIGDPVEFDASGSTDADGTVVDYIWNFGDGNVAQGQPTVSHEYAKAGSYQVQLTVVDDKGGTSAPVALAVVVSAPPAPTIFGLPASTVLIVVGAVVALVAIYLLATNLDVFRGGPPPLSRSNDSLQSAVKQDVDQFLLATGVPVSEVSSIEPAGSIDQGNRARWALDLANDSLIVFYGAEGGFELKRYEELTLDEINQLDLNQVGASSLVGLVSERLAAGDSVLKLTWKRLDGESFESTAVVGQDGKVKFDTFMSLLPLAITQEPAGN